MPDILIKNSHALIDGKWLEATVLCRQGKLRLNPELPSASEIQVIDAKGQYLLPGFIDIHTHGGCGIDVNAAVAEDYRRLAAFFAKQGTTSYCASVLTDTREKTICCIEEIKQAMKFKGGAQLLGLHLEGPFLSHEYKGSMPEDLLKEADQELFDYYYKAAEGAIRYITIAPELEGALALIGRISDEVAVALGHSAADYETSMEAIRLGARAVTHTCNAMRLFHHHEPALMGAALESDIYCEAICDGRHLHPGSVRILLKAKGWDRLVAVTDSIMAAGLSDGNYQLGVNDIVVVNGDAKLAHADIRAGSTLTMLQALKNIMKFTGQDLAQVSRLLSENPAKVLRIDHQKATISEGKDADLILLDQDYNLQLTIVGGEICYQAESGELCRYS